MENRKLTVELNRQGFCVVGAGNHDTIDVEAATAEEEDRKEYFETPYSLLSKVSPGYCQAFGNSLASRLRTLSATMEAAAAANNQNQKQLNSQEAGE